MILQRSNVARYCLHMGFRIVVSHCVKPLDYERQNTAKRKQTLSHFRIQIIFTPEILQDVLEILIGAVAKGLGRLKNFARDRFHIGASLLQNIRHAINNGIEQLQ